MFKTQTPGTVTCESLDSRDFFWKFHFSISISSHFHFTFTSRSRFPVFLFHFALLGRSERYFFFTFHFSIVQNPLSQNTDITGSIILIITQIITQIQDHFFTGNSQYQYQLLVLKMGVHVRKSSWISSRSAAFCISVYYPVLSV